VPPIVIATLVVFFALLATLVYFVRQGMGAENRRALARADALAAEQVAVAQNNAQKAKNVQINTEIESIRALVKVLGPNGYILYKAIQDGEITVMPIPMGNPLSIPVPTR
jgi:uncharacterized membrane protein affecting hemolysin expression